MIFFPRAILSAAPDTAAFRAGRPVHPVDMNRACRVVMVVRGALMRLVLLVSLLAGTGCTDYIFYPMRDMVLSPDVVGLEYEDLFIETGDQLRLHGWRLFSSTTPVATVLYFHGNAENISTHFGNVYWLAKQGYEI